MPYYFSRSTPEPPSPGGSSETIATLTSSNTRTQILTQTTNLNIDVIEFTSGTYSIQDMQINVDRSSRPLTLRPAPGATLNWVGPATSSGQIIGLGQSVWTKHVTLDGRPGGVGSTSGWIFKDIALAQSGVIEPRGTANCTFKYLTFQNLSRDLAVPGTAAFKAYCFYISGAGSGSAGNTDLLIDHCWFKAPAVNRDVSCIQLASSGVHSNISITNVMEMTNYHYGFVCDVEVTNILLDTWVMTNTGRSSTPASIRFTEYGGTSDNFFMSGTYQNIVATSSDPFSDDHPGAGTITNGGGNSGI